MSSLFLPQSHRESVRHEFIGILDELITLFPEGPFGSLAVLRGTDQDSSFFYNIRHIQQHRRMRALARLTQLVRGERGVAGANNTATGTTPGVSEEDSEGEEDGEEGEERAVKRRRTEEAASAAPIQLQQGAVVHVLVPIVGHFVFESTRQSQHHMVNEAAIALGALASLLSWVC